MIAILGHFISLLFYSTEIDYLIHSQTCYYLYVPPVRTELKNSCKTAFKYTTTSDWNRFQTELRLHNLVSLSHFKTVICILENKLMTCKCFLIVVRFMSVSLYVVIYCKC